MNAPLAVILEGTIEDGCAQVEVDELTANSKEIGTALAAIGYRVEVLSFTLDIEAHRKRLLKLAPDVAFNLVDSIEGKGDIISMAPMLMAHMGIPCTGTNTNASVLSNDKLLAKQILRANGVRTADWLTESQIEAGGPELKRPYILKSVTEHASFGLFADSVVSDRATLRKRWKKKSADYWGTWFAEEFIEGREFNQAVLAGPKGPVALPPAEIVFTRDFPKNKPRIVDYTAKWYKETPEYKGTVRSFEAAKKEKALRATLAKAALACWDAFGLAGYARVDFRLDTKGKPYVVDVNSNPFLTAVEGFGVAAAQAGIGFNDVVRAIVADAYRCAAKPAPRILAA